ncbi:MAG: ribosomal RNA small subunit methyltransferase A [Chloroflexi bacterium]|nr:ribosomal RNA small subunit methyltransferase A [Chloroflexota bacterium]MBU1749846.1 ribosomal RNA small subunit methyltransferase A [Chloroflexota bacterium]
MTGPSNRDILRQHGLRPRKSLGQHFIHDRNILERMADAAELAPGGLVVEVGAGLGGLTRVLAERVGPTGHVLALETDDALVPLLREALPTTRYPQVEPVHVDVLSRSPGELGLEAGGYMVVANLPYYITSAVLRHFLADEGRPRRMVLMVQREVAQRVVAEPPHMSLLAVSVQVYARPQVVLRVPAGAFVPRPAVDSAVLRLDVYPAPVITVPPAEFFAVVRAGFAQRRKQLRNALAAGLARPGPAIDAALAGAGIDGRRRAETLTLAEWDRLSAALTPPVP